MQLDTSSLASAVVGVAREIAALEPGPAAALRRGPLTGAGTAALWKLLAQYAPSDRLDEAGWGALIQAVAILTPKGKPTGENATRRQSAHAPELSMGAVLHAADISEVRLARLLTAPTQMRRQLSIRLCRRLAAADQRRFDLVTLARFMLYGDDRARRRIARDYYRAEGAVQRSKEEDTSNG